MKTKITNLLLTFLLVFKLGSVFAQDEEAQAPVFDADNNRALAKIAAVEVKEGVGCDAGWCWGEDPATAKEKNAVYSDAVKMKDWKTAYEGWSWLHTNVPYMHKAIYQNGEKILKGLKKEAEKAKDSVAMRKYRAELYQIYHERTAYKFGKQETMLQKEGGVAFVDWNKYGKDRSEVPYMYDLYTAITDIKENKSKYSILYFYMATTVYAKYDKYITEDQALATYDRISEIFDYNIENEEDPKKVEKWKSYQQKTDAFVDKIAKIDCDFINEKMAETAKAEPSNISYQKRTLRYILKAKCTDQELFPIVLENIYTAEPTAGVAKLISNQYLKAEDYKTALEWKQKAIELIPEDDNATKAEYTLDMAFLSYKSGKYSEARKLAYESVKLDNGQAADAYSFIGTLYMQSGKMCTAPNPVQARAVYLAAYDMYAKAGDNRKMSDAAAQFPTIEEIFTQNMKEGDPIDVGCWIGGKTTLRKRK